MFIFFQLAIVSLANAQPTVSASIKPLQLIAAAITSGDIGERTHIAPGLIIGSAQDPHHPFLRPSERGTLDEADILLWVGSQLETGLADLIEPASSVVINAYELTQERGLSVEGDVDPHIWLSTRNARVIAETLTQELMILDVENRQFYSSNLATFLSSLDLLDAQINTSLEGLKQIPFGVYHNAFSYYEKQYGLTHVANYTEGEELQPGIRKVLEVRESLEVNDVSCLLLEPSNNPEEIAQLMSKDMKLVSIDILGFNYATNSTGYRDFMTDITESIKKCLKP
ncbi:MAG: metal ABC transporter solute-binding protein, Zn/Mn family [Pseudohongiellaceae bacterium]